MNHAIIKKCIDELAKDDFRKDYVIGMLETLYEMQEVNTPVIPNYTVPYTPPVIVPTTLPNYPNFPPGTVYSSGTANATPETDEATLLDGIAAARLAEVKGMSGM